MHKLKGVNLLLEVLGGLVVAVLVDHGSVIIEYLQNASRCSQITLGLWVAYISYLVNVLRQVHGLAIALEDEEYDRLIGSESTRFERFVGTVCLTLVLLFPCVFVVFVELNKGAGAPGVLLYSYFGTGFAYIFWDKCTQRTIRRAQIKLSNINPRNLDDIKFVNDFERYVRVWIKLFKYQLVLCFITCICVFLPDKPVSLGATVLFWIPPVSWYPWFILALAGGYSVFDYGLNYKFYFR